LGFAMPLTRSATVKELKKAFDVVAVTGEYITKENLRTLMVVMNEDDPPTRDDVDAAWNALDKDGDGSVTFEEFVKFHKANMRRKRGLSPMFLMILCVLTFVLGGVLAGVGAYVHVIKIGEAWLGIGLGLMGLVVLVDSVTGFIGALLNLGRLVTSYYNLTVILGIGSLMAAGYTFIAAERVATVVEKEWPTVQAKCGARCENIDASEAAEKVRQNMYVMGSVMYGIVFLFALSLWMAARIIGRKRASTQFLQIVNLLLLPFGLGLCAGSFYIADTAVVSTAPIAAFFMFLLGAAVVAISFLGCFGIVLGNTFLLLLYTTIIFVLAIVLVGSGIIVFVQAEAAKAYVNNHWDTIRTGLPHTFSGKYDKEQFSLYLSSQLNYIGYVVLTAGAILSVQILCALLLRMSLQKQRMDANRANKLRDAYKTRLSRLKTTKSIKAMKTKWDRAWRSSRGVYLKCGAHVACCACSLFVIVCVVNAALAVLFVTSCDKYPASDSSVREFEMDVGARMVKVGSHFNRGMIEVVPSSLTTGNISVEVKNTAIVASMQPKGDGATLSSDGTTVDTGEKDPFYVGGVDASCQSAGVKITVPVSTSSTHGPLVPYMDLSSVSGYHGVDVDMTPSYSNTRFNGIKISSQQGSINVANLHVYPDPLNFVDGAENGLFLSSGSGDVFFANAMATCVSEGVGRDSSVSMRSNQGAITLESVTFNDCDVTLVGDSSPIIMDTISSTGGYGTFVATTSHGSIIGSAFTARTIDLTSSNAGVKITDVTTSVQLLAATQDGGVVIKDASSEGNIEVETSSGNVYISIKNGGFSGTYSLSSKGSVSIEKVDGSSTSLETGDDGQDGSKNGYINCLRSTCAYYGGVLRVASDTGSIKIVVK